jgi:hypothetical protein
VNWVSESSEIKNYDKTRFILSRIAGQNSFIWSEFLFGVLLSSTGEIDLLKLNPYIDGNTLHVLLHLVTITMLRANRLGLTNRCIGTAINLEELLVKVITSYCMMIIIINTKLIFICCNLFFVIVAPYFPTSIILLYILYMNKYSDSIISCNTL